MSQVVHPESHLEALTGLPFEASQTRVVDKQMQGHLTRQKKSRTFAHRVQVVQL